MSQSPVVPAVLLAAAIAGACYPPADEPSQPRGVIVLSLGAAPAAAVARPGQPGGALRLPAALAARAVDFRWAMAPAASPLATELSLLTGLAPAQHGATHPLHRPSSGVELAAERFARFGFRTAGFSDGGFVSPHWGFQRGFDEFAALDGASAETVLARGLEFLDRIAADDRYFLYLRLDAGPPPGERLAAARDGQIDLAEEEIEALAARHAAGLRRLGDALAAFFDGLALRGLPERATLALVAGQGLELGDHGRVGRHQLYPEVLHVPLLLADPRLPPGEAQRLVETADLAPALYALAGLAPDGWSAARAVPGLLRALRPGAGPATAVAESYDPVLQSSVLLDRGGRLHQLVETRLVEEPSGAWATRRTVFDLPAGSSSFRLVSFGRERTIRIAVDGEPRPEVAVGRRWSRIELDLPADGRRHRVELATDGCDVPRVLGLGEDPRCLSFKIQGVRPRRLELFELRSDPAAARDLSAEEPELLAELLELLESTAPPPGPEPERFPRTPEVKALLDSLGYLDWGR